MYKRPSLDELLSEGEFSLEDAKELAAILGNKSVRRALGSVLRKNRERDRISMLDLSGPQGLNGALALHGVVRGTAEAIEMLLTLGDSANGPQE